MGSSSADEYRKALINGGRFFVIEGNKLCEPLWEWGYEKIVSTIENKVDFFIDELGRALPADFIHSTQDGYRSKDNCVAHRIDVDKIPKIANPSNITQYDVITDRCQWYIDDPKQFITMAEQLKQCYPHFRMMKKINGQITLKGILQPTSHAIYNIQLELPENYPATPPAILVYDQSSPINFLPFIECGLLNFSSDSLNALNVVEILSWTAVLLSFYESVSSPNQLPSIWRRELTTE